MKKFVCVPTSFRLLLACGILVLLSSCNKDWNCVCTTSDPVSGFSSTAVTVLNDTKSQAEAACEGESGTSNGISTVCKVEGEVEPI